MAKILIVDDSIAARKSLQGILVESGHEVISEAINGIQAYGEYKIYRPDIVTMDITMPKVDGLEGISMIIAADPQAKIIVTSSIAQKNMVLKAMEKGAKHYLIKPFSPQKVCQVIQEVLKE